jgi:hypothetical protein
MAALTLDTVDGAWSNPVGGVGIAYIDGVAVAYGNTLQDQIRWGTPYHQPHQSGLGFTGSVGGSVGPMSVTENVPFEIGQLAHFNYEIDTGTNATAVDLGITLTFSIPSGSGTDTFTFHVNETPKIGSDDFIYFPSSIPNETFTLDGEEYVLKLLGFGNSPSELQSQFQSVEGGTNTALLWGKITQPIIPAPAAILLAGIGTAMVGWLRRRRTV